MRTRLALVLAAVLVPVLTPAPATAARPTTAENYGHYSLMFGKSAGQ
jgi:hypothetical protein